MAMRVTAILIVSIFAMSPIASVAQNIRCGDVSCDTFVLQKEQERQRYERLWDQIEMDRKAYEQRQRMEELQRRMDEMERAQRYQYYAPPSPYGLLPR